MRIYLLGFMGTGKTRVGRELAHLMKYPFVDLDDEIVKKEGMSVNDIFNKLGENDFRELERNQLHQSIKYEHAVISTGGGTPCFFDNIKWIKQHGLSIHLDVKKEVLLPRLWNGKNSRPLLRDLTKNDLAAFVEHKISGRRVYYNQASIQYQILKEDQKSAQELYRFINFF